MEQQATSLPSPKRRRAAARPLTLFGPGELTRPGPHAVVREHNPWRSEFVCSHMVQGRVRSENCRQDDPQTIPRPLGHPQRRVNTNPTQATGQRPSWKKPRRAGPRGARERTPLPRPTNRQTPFDGSTHWLSPAKPAARGDLEG